MKIIDTGIAEISFNRGELILHIKIKEGAEMTLEATKKHYHEIEKLTEGCEYYALIDTSNYFKIEPDALEFSSKSEAIAKRLAAAHYRPHVANRLTANVFAALYKPHIPVKIFNKKLDAVNWLRSLRLIIRQA
jgi:hypothetical protein